MAHALRRGTEMGARARACTPASAAGWTGAGARGQAVRQLGELTLPLLDKPGDDDPDLLFEPMAGKARCCAHGPAT